MDYARQEQQSLVRQSVVFDDGLKGALAIVMAQLHAGRVKWNGSRLPGDLIHPVARHE
jgi:hypothetical protein